MNSEIRVNKDSATLWTIGKYEFKINEQGERDMDTLLIEVECNPNDKKCSTSFKLNVLDDHMPITYKELLALRDILNTEVFLQSTTEYEQEFENKHKVRKLVAQTKCNVNLLMSTTGQTLSEQQVETLMQVQQLLSTIS